MSAKSQEERIAILDQASREIEKSGLGALARHVVKVQRAMRRHMPAKWRVPFGLEAIQDRNHRVEEGQNAVFLTQPQVATRFTHLVVTDDTAQHFVLNDYKIGKDSQVLDELDLTFFSMKYQENDVLSDIAMMRGDTAQCSQYVAIYVQRKVDGHGSKNFNGILWAEYDYDWPDGH